MLTFTTDSFIEFLIIVVTIAHSNACEGFPPKGLALRQLA